MQSLLDIPSILQYPEGSQIAALCDGVVFVIRAGQTSLDDIEDAKQKLDMMGVNIIGSILNRRRTFVSDQIYKRL